MDTPAETRWKTVLGVQANMVTPVKYSRQWWFAYFWKDASTRAGESMQQPQLPAARSDTAKQRFQAGVADARDRLFVIYGNLPGNTTPAKMQRLDGMEPTELRKVLTTLLHIGCRGVPLVTSGLGNDASADNILRCCTYKKGVVDVDVGWRSENRDWATIKKDQGCKRQVEVSTLRQKMNMDQPWHPYSDSTTRSHLWFRAGGEKDNDFYSVVSVGLDLKVVVSFPELEPANYPDLPQPQGDPNHVKAVRAWDDADRRELAGYVARVSTSTEPSRYFLATKVHAYMFLMKGLVLDTRKAAQYYGDTPFPEKGLENIALDDIYACFPIIRVHHEKFENGCWVCGKETGHTVFIQEAEFAWPEQQRKCRYSEEAREKLRQELQKVLQLPQYPLPAFSSAWSGGSRGYDSAEQLFAYEAPHGQPRPCRITQLLDFRG